MAAYVKHGDQVVLIYSRAEAMALQTLVERALEVELLAETVAPKNFSVVEARGRACRALSTACRPGSRSGAAIQ